jgi:hypothetical protein
VRSDPDGREWAGRGIGRSDRVGGEGNEGGVREGASAEEAGEGLRGLPTQHRECPQEFAQASLADRGSGPALPQETAVNIRVPENAVPVLEQPFVCRSQVSPRQSRLVAEGGLEHISDMEELVAQEGQQRVGVQ